MFVITADQVNSRNDHDRAGAMIATLVGEFGDAFTLPPDQTAGDEIQMLVTDARTSLDLILALHRSGHWSIGLGIGTVRTPLPDSARQAAGEAFINARDAVTRAKKTETRFGLTANPAASADQTGRPDRHRSVLGGEEVEALTANFLLLRRRRTAEGWAAVDLREAGLAQVDIAARLGISTAAVSQRLRSALWKVDQAALPALVRLLEDLDNATTETGPAT